MASNKYVRAPPPGMSMEENMAWAVAEHQRLVGGGYRLAPEDFVKFNGIREGNNNFPSGISVRPPMRDGLLSPINRNIPNRKIPEAEKSRMDDPTQWSGFR